MEARVGVNITTQGAQAAAAGIDGMNSSVLALNQALEISKKAFEFLKGEFAAMSEKYATSARLDAVLASTKGAAGMTRTALDDLTKSITSQTLASANSVREAEHMLLTFTQIGKNVFPEATETVMNMATAFGVDAKTSAVQLGKALNDPINGMNALRRVGVSFSSEQKKQIRQLQEQGDLQGAQKIILMELQTEFGGLAKKMAETPTGRIEHFNKALSAAKGMFIDLMLKGLTPIIDGLSFLDKWIRAGIGSLGAFKNILGPVLGTLGLLIAAVASYTVIQQLAIVKTTIMAAVENGRKVVLGIVAAGQWLYNGAITAYNALVTSGIAKTVIMTALSYAAAAASGIWTAAQWLLNAAMTANPIGLIIAGIGALIAVILLVSGKIGQWVGGWQGLWDKIKAVGEFIFKFMTPVGLLIQGLQYLYEKFGFVRVAVDAVWSAIKAVWDAIVGAYNAVMDFLGLGDKADEEADKQKKKQQDAAKESQKTAEQDFETKKKAMEDLTKKNEYELRIRASKEKWTKEKLDQELQMEQAKHMWRMNEIAQQAGEDAAEYEAAARDKMREIQEQQRQRSREAAEKTRKREEEYQKSRLAAIEDERLKLEETYAYELGALREKLRRKEIEERTFQNLIVTLNAKHNADLKKLDEDEKKKKDDARKAEEEYLKSLYEKRQEEILLSEESGVIKHREAITQKLQAEIEYNQQLADLLRARGEDASKQERLIAMARVKIRNEERGAEKEKADSIMAARETNIGLLETERERIDARSAYDKDRLEQERKSRYMSDEEFQAKTLEIEKATADAKKELNISMTKDVFSEIGGMVDKKTAAGKGIAVAQAMMNTWEGATKALAQGGILGPILAGVVIAAGMMNVQKILAVNPPKAKAQGGSMFPGELYQTQEQGREYIVNAEATRRNYGLLSAINAGASPSQPVGFAMPTSTRTQTVNVGGRFELTHTSLVAAFKQAMKLETSHTL